MNLTKNQLLDIDKIYLYDKGAFKSKYELLINRKEKVGISNLKNRKPFIDFSQTIDDVYEHLQDYDPAKKRKVLIVVDDMIADVETNNKSGPIVTELFLRERKLNILLVFTLQSHFKVPKTIRLNVTRHFLREIPNKSELQQIALNDSSDNDFKDLMKLCKDYTKEPYSFLVNDTNLSSELIMKMIVNEKIKTIDNKIEQNKAQYNLDRQTAKISPLSSGNVSKDEFLTGKDVLPEKDLLEKPATIKIFEYLLIGKELKAQTGFAKDQYKFFKDQMNANNNNTEKNESDEDKSDEDKSDENKTLKKFNAILTDIENNGRATKPISVKTRGSNINLYPLIMRLLNVRKTVLKKDYGFDEVCDIFDEIDINLMCLILELLIKLIQKMKC